MQQLHYLVSVNVLDYVIRENIFPSSQKFKVKKTERTKDNFHHADKTSGIYFMQANEHQVHNW